MALSSAAKFLSAALLLIHELLKMTAHEGLCFFSGHVCPKLIFRPPGPSNDFEVLSGNPANGLRPRRCVTRRPPQFQKTFSGH